MFTKSFRIIRVRTGVTRLSPEFLAHLGNVFNMETMCPFRHNRTNCNQKDLWLLQGMSFQAVKFRDIQIEQQENMYKT